MHRQQHAGQSTGVPPTRRALSLMCPAPQSVEGGARPSALAVFLEVATLIFLAEWGDRWGRGGGGMEEGAWRGDVEEGAWRCHVVPYWPHRKGGRGLASCACVHSTAPELLQSTEALGVLD